jgi:heme/copper-type cytochrome/quinol oxidase subunit 2
VTILVILAIVVGALVVAAIAYTQRSRQNTEPIQLGVGRKLRP